MLIENVFQFRREEIKEEDIKKLLKKLQQVSSGNLLIESFGGYVGSFFLARETLLKKEINIIGGNVISSSAINIFLCGKKRFAYPNTIFQFHQIKYKNISKSRAQENAQLCWWSDDTIGIWAWQSLAQELQTLEIIVARFIAQRSKLFFDRVMNFFLEEKTLTAVEAKDCGIIHDIILPQQVQFIES